MRLTASKSKAGDFHFVLYISSGSSCVAQVRQCHRPTVARSSTCRGRVGVSKIGVAVAIVVRCYEYNRIERIQGVCVCDLCTRSSVAIPVAFFGQHSVFIILS